jgi:TonB dependent receptor
MSLPWAQRLTLTMAARVDDYRDFGSSSNPQIGLEWDPLPDLTVRGAWSTSFRAPSLFELYMDSTVQMGQVVDPLRPPNTSNPAGEVVIVPITFGGNRHLEPETAESFNIGLVYQPRWAGGLEVSTNYFSIRQDARVMSPNLTLLILNQASFPSQVTRAAPTAADIAAGRPGALTALDLGRINAGGIHTSSMPAAVRAFADRRPRAAYPVCVCRVDTLHSEFAGEVAPGGGADRADRESRLDAGSLRCGVASRRDAVLEARWPGQSRNRNAARAHLGFQGGIVDEAVHGGGRPAPCRGGCAVARRPTGAVTAAVSSRQ